MLLLFDLDGTLLTANGMGHTAVDHAVSQVLGREASSEGVSFSGKTDRQIFREVLKREADQDPNDELVRATSNAYEAYCAERMTSSTVDALAGSRALLDTLQSLETRMGLLTGNIESMAYRKLECAGLGGVLGFGAFGSDAEDRDALPAIAADRAAARYGARFSGPDVVVIGDTPRDIGCARAFGARAVAVSTGHYDADALAEHQPDVLYTALPTAADLLAALQE